MQTVSRKRKVSSCIPCYTRKQKVSVLRDQSRNSCLQSAIQCSRQYPCNHCTRRARPGECVYYNTAQAMRDPTLPLPTEYKQCGDVNQAYMCLDPEPLDAVSGLKGPKSPMNTWPASLPEVFGYSEESQSNTMALLRRVRWSAFLAGQRG